MATKLHLLVPQEIVRSVLNGTEATAECGFSKVYTREGIEAARGSGGETCKGCLVAVGADVAKGDHVTLHPAEGWAALLERAFGLLDAERAPRAATTFSYRINFSAPREFPLAS